MKKCRHAIGFGGFLGILTLLSVASGAIAQDMESAGSQPAIETLPAPEVAPPPKGKGKKTVAKPKEAKSGLLLPDWTPPAFGVNASPIAGFRYQYSPSDKSSTTQLEIGGMLGVAGIPLYPGNPGLYVEPYAGYALGQSFVSASIGDTKTGTYHRPFGGVRIPLLVRFYKHTLGLNYAQVKGELVDTRKIFGVESDNAFLLLPFFSAHYTFSYEKSAGSTFDEVLSETYDQWYHARAFAKFLSAYVDVGPGVTFRKTYHDEQIPLEGIKSIEGNSTTTYAKALGGFDVIPGFLGAELQGKYVLSSKIDGTITYDASRSPAEDLGAAEQRLGLPDDSLYFSAFIGLKHVFGSMGIGWRYNLDVANALERNGTRSKQSSQGIGVHYSVRM